MSRSLSLFVLALAPGVFVAVAAGAASKRSPLHVTVTRHAARPSIPGWPQLLRSSHHASYAANPTINATSASGLGIDWMAPLRAADLGSPVSVYNATLGTTVAYVGDERGDVSAYDEANGTTLWSTSIGYVDALRASPLAAPDGSLWVATAYGSTLYKLNGATGSVECSVKAPLRFNASPMLATARGVPTVFIATNDAGNINGVELAVRESDCHKIWSFNKWLGNAGAWATSAFAIDANGKARVYVGTADPDSTMYALDANTGKRIWYFSIQNPPPGRYDIGAGATVSLPGANGFADGVLYFPTKYGIMYALDLTTGAMIWQYNFNADAHTVEGGRSSAALDGTTLVFGMANGIYALDARSGNKLWHYIDPAGQEVTSSPAIVGPSGNEVVGFGDVAGAVHFLRLSDGKDQYDYQTGNYITSSPAVIDGHFLIDSTDGFLYDFRVGGGNVAPGTTAVTSPAGGSQVPNPQGNLTVSGSAADQAGVNQVLISIQAGGPTGSWYNAATGNWVGGAVDNAVAASPQGNAEASWTIQFPVPSSGQTYQVFANEVDVLGQVDRTGAQSSFTVLPNANLPQLALSTSLAPPGGSFNVTGSGFAANETVTFALQGATVGSAPTDVNGNIAGFPIAVPASDAFGPSALVATGQTSGLTTTAPIDITNTWSALGYGSTRTGYEPNDNVLANTLQATRHGYVARAWLFTTGAAVDSSPAIVAGTAYVGNDAGQLSAVDVASGAPFWTYATPTGQPIHGSPAVDAGNVVFGADDGSLYTLSAVTGTLLGSAQLDGIPTAPAIAGGAIYTATDNGTVFSLAEATGAVLWSTPVGAAMHSAPSVDVSAGLVIVGDDSGNVTTLDAATGAIVYQVPTGGAVTAAAAIAGGNVYVGSSDGNLYAFVESSGVLKYEYNAGAPVHAVATTGTQIYVGDDSGSLSLVTAATGKVVYKLSFGSSPLVGVGASLGVPFVETADGKIGAIKNDQARVLYDYQTASNLTTQPAVVDGTVYVGAEDGSLYAFTSYGRAPIDAKEHRLLGSLRKKYHSGARWNHPPATRRVSLATRAFAPAGPRDFPLHVDRAAATPPNGSIVWHGGPVQRSPKTYLIYWDPAARANGSAFAAAAAALAQGGSVAATALDATSYPRRVDDGAVQREIARQMVANHWSAGPSTQVFVLTGPDVTASANRYCGYHSAFDLGAKLGSPLPYAFLPHPDGAAGCGTLSALLRRERAELRMDPFLNGWHDAAGNEPTT